MNVLRNPRLIRYLALATSVILAGIMTGCAAGLFPQFTYQGRLTDGSGNPVNGNVTVRFSLFDAASGGTSLYSETDNVTVTDGFFDTVVGPNTAVGGLTPELLSQPLWVELQVSDGTYTETLTPRQRLYGAPYAFTLMPGAVVSSTMGSIFEGGGVQGLLSLQNNYDGDSSDPAIPALRVVGETGIELTSPTNDDGTIYSDRDQASSDIFAYSQDNFQIYLDEDDNEAGTFVVVGNTGNCSITDSGNLSCSGAKAAAVAASDGQRLMYAIESPEVWFEDFGSAQLVEGNAAVTFDPLFAETVNLETADYHVFLTPLGDCNGLYVAQKSAAGFEVRELGGGTANIAFDFRIVAKRVGYEKQRLELQTSDVE